MSVDKQLKEEEEGERGIRTVGGEEEKEGTCIW